jgi:hypothetical protein
MPCCCESCLIFHDTFIRANHPDLGSNWVDNGEDFSIFEYDAKSDVAGAKAILDIPHPVPDTSMYVELKTKDEIIDGGVKYRILVNLIKLDPDNFYFAEFERNGFNNSVIRLGVSSNGIETILKEDFVVGLGGFARTFIAIFSENEFCASVTNAVQSFVGTVPSGAFALGYYCGMYVDTEDILIDEFLFYEHFTTNPECPNCLCRCGLNDEIPPKLRVRIYADPVDCDRLELLDPCEFDIEWDRLEGAWDGEDTCCEGYTGTGQGWRIRWYCPQVVDGVFDPYTARMGIFVGCTNSCTGCGVGTHLPIEASCDTISMTYGPFWVSGTDLTCFCTLNTEVFTRPGCNFYVQVFEI